MLMPSIFEKNFFDDFFTEPFSGYKHSTLMQTDVKEDEKGYELTMNLPGVKKEDIKADLKEGYLTITATTSRKNEETDKNGKYIRRERFSGSSSRSFYVGTEVTQDEIKAKFENGILTFDIPKKEANKQIEQKQYISIAG